MNTKNRISVASLLAAASLTFSPSAWSLGLGELTVESFLHQPLQVKIDLISRETDDLTTVSAGLASAADYELIGASRESISVPIGFSIEDIQGDAYILATSNLPVSEPVVRLIVEVNWSSGRLLREYTVFLDPATVTSSAPIPRMEMRETPPVPVSVPAAPAVVEKSPQPEARPATESTSPRQPVDGEYGPVASGETLWGIASNWSRGTGLDVNQVMIAIQRENPSAFLRDNINLLKRGAILRMPRVSEVRDISRAAALDEVSAQSEAFRDGRQARPATSPETPLLAEEAANVEEISESEESAYVPDPVVPEPEEESVEPESGDATAVAEPAPEPTPQLELVPPSADSDLDSAYGFEESDEAGADATVAVSTLREDLARTEEELVTQQQQNEYLAERIRELEAQLASTEQDSVKDADLANMESRLREERLAEASQREADAPWYKRFSAWLIGLVVIAIALGGWFLSRRGRGDEFASAAGGEEETLREIKDEAQEVLRVLEDEKEDDAAGAEEEKQDETEVDEAVDASPESEKGRPAKSFGGDGGDAEVLDEESSDPEIQLDLARAYISMGDKEAARVILEEVSNNGTEKQREEARKMLELLVP
jgi:pilus assembly protein FimV